jgi:hypothetical protein
VTLRELLAAIGRSGGSSCTRRTGLQSHKDDGEEKDAGIRAQLARPSNVTAEQGRASEARKQWFLAALA